MRQKKAHSSSFRERRPHARGRDRHDLLQAAFSFLELVLRFLRRRALRKNLSLNLSSDLSRLLLTLRDRCAAWLLPSPNAEHNRQRPAQASRGGSCWSHRLRWVHYRCGPFGAAGEAERLRSGTGDAGGGWHHSCGARGTGCHSKAMTPWTVDEQPPYRASARIN